MMPKVNNPFQPTQPVYRGMFAGRTHEINRIETILQETKQGNPTNLLIIGERGIGKTSLLLLSRCLASGEIHSNYGKLNFMTVVISVDKRTCVANLASKINVALQRELGDSEKTIQFLRKAWAFIQRIEISGTKIGGPLSAQNEPELFDSFTYSIVDTVKAITSDDGALNTLGLRERKDGLVIFIDEADNATIELDLGTFVKQLSEKLVAEKCNNVLIVLSGLPDIRKILTQSHGSALRLFEELELLPLSPNDVKQVIRQGLSEANSKNSQPVQILDPALDLIVVFSEGYPHFVQQFGYSSYAVDEDDLIDEKDVEKAAFSPRGAFDLIGDRYYKDMYFNKIKKDSYRQVLKIMSEKWTEWISKQEIRSQFKGKHTTLNNAVNALAGRNVILRKPGTRGEYRLQWNGFAFWIKSFATRLEMNIGSYNGKLTSTDTD
jgi:hypothetical protein